ncbi:MAG TPA: AraC family transcriptional regulator, partial [Anaerovoracaceae bacterium]|nr:AraC family transcriptional regulator [Anaerovoracaceae bacterium]
IQSYISAGPIAMGNNKENIIRGLIRKIEPKSESLPELALFLNEMCIFNPREVGHLASLLNSVVMSSINSPEDYRKINEHYKEQMDFGEQIQKYKRKRIPMDYPHELENELIQRVQNRDSEGIQEMMLELLKEISLYVSGDLSAIKVRALGICAVLARVSKGQQGSFEISSDEIEVMDLLNKAKTFKDICTYSSLICENFFDRMSEPEYKGDSQIVLSACKYIHENYMDRITLRTVAGELYTNASYLSSLFKKETGVSFTGYLNDVRMKQARDLLLHTNLSLLEISMRAGFDCQSYFSKVFKRTYDVTPREYRRKSVEGEI